MTQEQFFQRYTYNVSTDKLGGGAFGTVYKAYDNVLDKQVAIKIAEVKQVGGKTFSLLDEFDALKDLPAHKNIAHYEQVYTFRQQNGVFDYAVIQYYPHGNLKALQENNHLSTVEKETIATQLLEGIEFLHNNNVIHRDLKPSNILVHRRSNGQYIPKIADFGLSKKTSSERMTNSFSGGTVEFSAPEQLKGKRIKKNADLWSFGVIAYELFTGKRLFATNSHQASAEQNQELFQQIFDKDVTEKLQDTRIPEQWKTVLTQCLEKDNHQRIETATELMAIVKGSQQQVQDDATVIKTVVQPKQVQEQKTIRTQHKSRAKKTSKKKNLKWLIPVAILLLLVSGWFISSILFKKSANEAQVVKNGTEKINQDNKSLPFSPEEVLRKKYGTQYRFAEKSDFNWSIKEVESILSIQQNEPDYPFIAKGDFNRDGETEYAFYVIQNTDNSKHLFIYNPKFDYDFVPNISTVGHFDAISKEAKSKLLNPKTGMFIPLMCDAIMLENFNGENYLFYYNGGTYKLENMGL